VTISFARRTRWKWSTAICAYGSAARIPDAYGADGSITTVLTPARKATSCSASQLFTQPPERPGASPSSRPRLVGSASTNDVSQGSERLHPVASRSQRTLRARVSSIPSTAVGVGSGSHLAAAATRARWAVCQATPCSAATSDTARFDPAIALAKCSRSLAVSRDRGGIAAVRSRKEHRGHEAGWQTSRRLRHHSSTRCPDAGRSFTRRSGRSFTRADSVPHSGHAASRATVSTTTRTASDPTRSTSTTVNSPSPNRSVVRSSMLVASSTGCLKNNQHGEATSLTYLATPPSSAESLFRALPGWPCARVFGPRDADFSKRVYRFAGSAGAPLLRRGSSGLWSQGRWWAVRWREVRAGG